MATKNPPDLVKQYIDMINESRAKLEEALDEIAMYSRKLAQITSEAHQRLITRD